MIPTSWQRNPPGTKYNIRTGKLVDNTNQLEETEEESTARILKEVANSVQVGIVMEEDFPSRNADGKLPILDMKVWMNNDNFAV